MSQRNGSFYGRVIRDPVFTWVDFEASEERSLILFEVYRLLYRSHSSKKNLKELAPVQPDSTTLRTTVKFDAIPKGLEQINITNRTSSHFTFQKKFCAFLNANVSIFQFRKVSKIYASLSPGKSSPSGA
jgi:hypothetical protein